MLQITPHMKILVAVEPVDFRRGMDGLAQWCRAKLQHDPFTGAVFVFRNRPGSAWGARADNGSGAKLADPPGPTGPAMGWSARCFLFRASNVTIRRPHRRIPPGCGLQ